MAKGQEKPQKQLLNTSTIISTIIAVLALILSAYSLYRGEQDSYLSHRATLAPADWGISPSDASLTDATVFFHVYNSGSTPGVLTEASCGVMIGGTIIASQDLIGEPLGIVPALPEKYIPEVGGPLGLNMLPKLLNSQRAEIVLTLRYTDYARKKRGTTSRFIVVRNPDGKGIHLQLVGQELF